MPQARVKIYIPIAHKVSTEATMVFMERVLQEMRAGAVGIASEGPYVTGKLAASIELQGPKIYGEQVRGAIGSRLPEALVIHDGAGVHEIFPKGATHVYRFGSRRRPQLRFFWLRAGRVAYFPHIPGARHKIGLSHPGMSGKKYLEIPLEIVGRRHGFKVTTRGL
jgi:hypothetical protein